MAVTTQGVVAAAYFSASSTLVLALLLLIFFEVNLLLSIPLAAMASIVAYYIVISYPIS
ncbi:unnamed protein product, partial [marine sediment metagenome]